MGRSALRVVFVVNLMVGWGLVGTKCCQAEPITGHYLEARTCQVYTGPCFANGEVGMAGKDAVMAWSIDAGELDGADLAGLNVAVVLKASNTLGFQGLEDADQIQSMIVVDRKATPRQRAALVQFAKSQTGKAAKDVQSVLDAPFTLQLDLAALTAKLKVGELVKLQARKARPEDCICSNESAYYPPLAKLQGFVPGVTLDGQVKARSLRTRWSIPDSRSSYLGTFSIQ
ncbi:MAG: DUF1326 domain-containing protein [Planctomycetaceae bacterium]|nr:DUF1326 domain-containing protein [Planctomycetaceae bacterium]